MKMENEWVKATGMSWVEVEHFLGIASGPDFTAPVMELDTDRGENIELYSHGIYALAASKKQQRMLKAKEDRNES